MLVGDNYPFFSLFELLLYSFRYINSIRFDNLCFGHMPELSTPFLPISLTKAIDLSICGLSMTFLTYLLRWFGVICTKATHQVTLGPSTQHEAF